MRVLLLAQGCNPEAPSEPSIVYNVAREIADRVDVVVATSVRHKGILSARGIGRAEIVYFDTEYIVEPVCRIGNLVRFSPATATAIGVPAHIAFDWEVWKHFKEDMRLGQIDIVHRLTPVTSAIPSAMAKWSKVPFVIGPVNGGLKYPRQFGRELRREGEWLRYLRGANRFMPYMSSTYRKAAAIFAAFPHATENLPTEVHERIIEVPEIGFDPELFRSPPVRCPRERLTFLFVGRLMPFKGIDNAVAAFGSSEVLRRHRLLIVGDGPDRDRLKQMVQKLSLESCVEFLENRHGRPFSEVVELMREADVFVYPAVREAGGAVVIEAMASGLPCAVTDHGGPATLITPECGVKVPLTTHEELVAGLARELERLASDPELRERLGTAAWRRAQCYFTWSAKARTIVETYRWVLGQRQEKPDHYSLENPDTMILESAASC